MPGTSSKKKPKLKDLYNTLFFKIFAFIKYFIIYLINSKNLINSSTFIKAKINNYIKVKITSFLIIKYSTYIIKNIILYNIIVIKEFYINIISETYLVKRKLNIINIKSYN